MSTAWYHFAIDDVVQQLETDGNQGLTDSEAQRRMAQVGPNELVERGQRPWWRILLGQVTDVMTLILIAAAIISLFLGDMIDAIVILAIVVLNAALGFSQEYRAEQSMAALKRMSVPKVHVRRDGKAQEISARELVPGDVVLLETGNILPADGRVIESMNLRVQESTLTGESEAVDKEADLVFADEQALGDRRNMLYSGTTVTYGHGAMAVTATGMETELGKIADMLQSVEAEKTPLQQRLDKLGKALAIVAIVLVIVIFIIGVLGGQPVETMLLTAVSLAVAAVPEAMTAVVTIALSLGAQRMLKRKALIRKLPAVETLGSVSIICSDKTGTLTQNRMTVTVLDIANRRIDLAQRPDREHLALIALEQKDIGRGDAKLNNADKESADPSVLATLDLLLVGGALCNDAVLTQDESHTSGNGTLHQNGYTVLGDPTEGALVLAAAEFGILKPDLDMAFPRVAEFPFDSTRKRMTTVHATPTAITAFPPSLQSLLEGGKAQTQPPYQPPFLAITKGAIDSLLPLTREVWVEGRLQPFDETWQTRIMAAHDQLAENGMRVLAVGIRALENAPTEKGAVESLEHDLILIGLFGMMDPPRPEVAEAVQKCKDAGIRPIMITGDHPLTARHIAKQIGISEGNRFFTGAELDGLSDAELATKSQEIAVFARVAPEHKLALIQSYQDQGHIVAMTGDGVNDAPALKKADIGVAMGITGTDVSKEASEMILLDDNFSTIVAAVEEGRIIYDNIRKFIKYLLTCNASEIAVMLFGPFLGMPLPLLPLQILWMNLVTDGLPALALGVEPAEENVMHRPPTSSQESIFGHGMVLFIVGMGCVMSLVALGVGTWAYRSGNPAWQSLLFTTLIFAQLALALGVRSEENRLFKIGLFTNRSMVWAVASSLILHLFVLYMPFFQNVFGTQPLGMQDFIIAALASLLVLFVAEVWKWVLRRRALAT